MSRLSESDDGTKARIIETNFGRQGKSRTPKSTSGGTMFSSFSSGTYSSVPEGEIEGSVPLSEGERRLRRQSALEQHAELAQDIQKDIIAFFSSSALTTYMSLWAKIFLGCVALSVLFTCL
eukprot:PhF_6_TR28815/c0_g1_i2/m.42188